MIAAVTNASSLADYIGVFTATRRLFLPLVSIQKTERQIRERERDKRDIAESKRGRIAEETLRLVR